MIVWKRFPKFLSQEKGRSNFQAARLAVDLFGNFKTTTAKKFARLVNINFPTPRWQTG